jgi:hypothetical protein
MARIRHDGDGGATTPGRPRDDVISLREEEEMNVGLGPDAMHVDQPSKFTQCVAHDCPNAGVQIVIYEVVTRWPNGRQLVGCLQFEELVCEEHFELLVRGRNVRV